MNSPRDSDGHCTLTASVAAGNFVEDPTFFGYATGTAKGVSPRARLAAYKTYWDEEQSSTADLLAAIDQGVADGVDIISMSLSLYSPEMSRLVRLELIEQNRVHNLKSPIVISPIDADFDD